MLNTVGYSLVIIEYIEQASITATIWNGKYYLKKFWPVAEVLHLLEISLKIIFGIEIQNLWGYKRKCSTFEPCIIRYTYTRRYLLFSIWRKCWKMYDFLLGSFLSDHTYRWSNEMMNALCSVKNIFGFFRGAAENLFYQIYWRMKIAVIMLMSIRWAEQTRKRKKELESGSKNTL